MAHRLCSTSKMLILFCSRLLNQAFTQNLVRYDDCYSPPCDVVTSSHLLVSCLCSSPMVSCQVRWSRETCCTHDDVTVTSSSQVSLSLSRYCIPVPGETSWARTWKRQETERSHSSTPPTTSNATQPTEANLHPPVHAPTPQTNGQTHPSPASAKRKVTDRDTRSTADAIMTEAEQGEGEATEKHARSVRFAVPESEEEEEEEDVPRDIVQGFFPFPQEEGRPCLVKVVKTQRNSSSFVTLFLDCGCAANCVFIYSCFRSAAHSLLSLSLSL